MEKTDHTLLVSHGAVQLAETLQVEKVRLIFKQKTTFDMKRDMHKETLCIKFKFKC